ncbi:MAG: hypothetical protein QM766_13130 [Burkholderiaceae bacterium]
MSSSLFPDPLQFWRDALTRLEGEANNLASSTLKTPEAARSAQTLASMALSLQQFSDKAMSDHLRRLNIPSRKDVAELAESLVRIEGKLDQLLPLLLPPSELDTPRPARTRRPSSQSAPAPAPAPAADAQPAAAAAEADSAPAPAPADAEPAPTRARAAAETAPAGTRSAKAKPAERRRGTRATKG